MSISNPSCLQNKATPDAKSASIRPWLWRTLGTISVSIGLINVFIPLMPTTVFLIIGLWAWGKGAPELKARLLQHPRFGPSLRDWENGGRISRRGKWLSISGIAASFAVSAALIGARPATAIVGLCLLVLALWLWRRPEPARQDGLST